MQRLVNRFREGDKQQQEKEKFESRKNFSRKFDFSQAAARDSDVVLAKKLETAYEHAQKVQSLRVKVSDGQEWSQSRESSMSHSK